MPEGETTGPGGTNWVDWHLMLLRMAGAVPDDLICQARAWLAQDEAADVAQALAFAAGAARIPILAAEAELMVDQLSAADRDISLVKELDILGEEAIVPSPWSFAPVSADADEGDDPGPLLDLTAQQFALADLDQLERAALDAARNRPDVTALWRAWRRPSNGSPWPVPRRVFVVGLAAGGQDADLPALTAHLQDVLTAVGEKDPQVEVVREDLPVPGYQGAACANAALLWAAEPAVPIQLARIFDAVDPQLGPIFHQGHPVIEDRAEVARLVDYLDGALPVLTTGATMHDIIDPDHPQIVPLTFRTDGHWIWTDTVSYYLGRYALAPEEALLAHLRSAGATPAPVSDVALHRVLSFLQRPSQSEPIWVVPEMGDAGDTAWA